MTDRNRALRTLPEGYQFGDAGLEWYERARPRPHTAGTFGSSSMTPPLTGPGADDRKPWRAPHLNAAEQLQRRAGWNVIEGEDH